MIPRARPNYTLRDLFAALRHGRRSGPLCAEVERELARFFDIEHVATAPSGRGAMYALLRALPQSTVVLPAFTCTAVTEAALLAGKRVVYVDVPRGAFNLRPEDVAPSLTADTILIATHQYGIPCDAPGFAAQCERANAVMIEDVAAALGTRIGGRLVGTFGAAAFGSFDTTKLIHTPLKAGFILCQDPVLFADVRRVAAQAFKPMPRLHKWRLLMLGAALVVATSSGWLYRVFHFLNFGLRDRHTAESAEPARARTEFYRYCMAEWQAAIALPQVRRLGQLVGRRRELYARFLDGLKSLSALDCPPEDRAREWGCVRFSVLTHGDKMAYYRKAGRAGVDMGFSFTSFPFGGVEAAELGRRVLNLPFYDRLHDREMRQVISALKKMDGTA